MCTEMYDFITWLFHFCWNFNFYHLLHLAFYTNWYDYNRTITTFVSFWMDTILLKPSSVSTASATKFSSARISLPRKSSWKAVVQCIYCARNKWNGSQKLVRGLSLSCDIALFYDSNAVKTKSKCLIHQSWCPNVGHCWNYFYKISCIANLNYFIAITRVYTFDWNLGYLIFPFFSKRLFYFVYFCLYGCFCFRGMGVFFGRVVEPEAFLSVLAFSLLYNWNRELNLNKPDWQPYQYGSQVVTCRSNLTKSELSQAGRFSPVTTRYKVSFSS